MSSFVLNRVGVLSLVVASYLATCLASSPAIGQEVGEAKPASAVQKSEKLTGRLPPYYGQVVSKEQRTKIYEVQTRYADQIQKLRDQIVELEKTQLDEIAAVLSPEQQQQVAKLAADAKSKRSKKVESDPGENPAK